MFFTTGDLSHRSPEGYSVFLDQSWDARGTYVACRTNDIIRLEQGNATRMSRLYVRDGAVVLTGDDALDFLYEKRQFQETGQA